MEPNQQTPQPTPTPTPNPQQQVLLTLEQALKEAQASQQQPQATPTEQKQTSSTNSSAGADDVNKKLADAIKLNEQHAQEIKGLNEYNRKLMEENNKLYKQVVALLTGQSTPAQQTPQQQHTGGAGTLLTGNMQQDFINKLKGGY